MDEHVPNPLDVDAIVARHPEHGFVIDGFIAPPAEELLRRLGYHRNEHNVLALPADMDEQTARDRQVRAAQILAATGHAVAVLPDDEAARAAGFRPKSSGDDAEVTE